jgi:glycosyltransferase involved in cell wall biosynthesis
MNESKKNVLVLTTWSFRDGLIQSATLPYLKKITGVTGGTVHLVCLEKKSQELTSVQKAAARQELAQWGIVPIFFTYHKMNTLEGLTWVLRIWQLFWLVFQRRIDVIHAFCTPAGAIGYYLSLLTGRELIIDSYEPHADPMAESGAWRKSSLLYKALYSLETKMSKRASWLLAVSRHIDMYMNKRMPGKVDMGKVLYRPLCVDPDLFRKTVPDYSLLNWQKKEKKFIGVYTGRIGGMYYEEEIVNFVKCAIDDWKGDFYFIFCTPVDAGKVTQLFLSQGIPKENFFVGFVPHTEIPRYLSLADFAISFTKPTYSRQFSCPTKNAEFWSMGLPIVMNDAVLDDSNYVRQNPFLGILLNDFTNDSLQGACSRLEAMLPDEGSAEKRRAFISVARSFDIAEDAYQAVYAAGTEARSIRRRPLKKPIRNIVILTTWSYKDALVQSSVMPYLKFIHAIRPGSILYLVTQEASSDIAAGSPERQAVDRFLANQNIVLVAQPYHRFGIRKIIHSVFQFLQLLALILRKDVSHIHCMCTPAGGIGYLLSKLTGRALIIDSYEPHAESMVENGTWGKNSFAFRLLWWLEKKQSKRADYCIAAATGMENYALEKYGVTVRNIGLRPACVDLQKFSRNETAAARIRSELGWNDKLICVYAGKFGGIYLGKEAFDFFRAASDYYGDRFRVLILTPSPDEVLTAFCAASNLPRHSVAWRKVPFEQVPDYLSAADFAFTPVKPVPSKRYCTPIKDGEYWSIGLPVVITDNISDDSAIIEENGIGSVIYTLDNAGYLAAIRKIDNLLAGDRALLRARIRQVAETYRNYDIARLEYEKVYGDTETALIEV